MLGLIAHEYFHAWNVKRLKPREFATLDYARENYTRLLWFFEGFTSYYDDLFAAARRPDRRAALPEAARDDDLGGRRRRPAARVQSVAAASFDAWVKYYRADENTPNATISYYAKGSLVALALDLTLAQRRQGLARRRHAPALAEERRRPDRRGRHRRRARGGRRPLVRSASSRPGCTAPTSCRWPTLLQRFGVEVEAQPATLAQRLGVRVSESALTGVKVTHVLRGGAGERAGLAPGDELIGVGGWRLRRLDDALARRCRSEGDDDAARRPRPARARACRSTVGSLAAAEAGALQLQAGREGGRRGAAPATRHGSRG